MKIVVAFDTFKGCVNGYEASEYVASRLTEHGAEAYALPLADGGEGTVDAMLFNGGKKIIVKIKGPLFDEAEAFYGILPDNTAVIEMAAASGLPLVGVYKNPLLTTTYGTGQLIRDALD